MSLKPLPPGEAVRFFRNKGFAIGFDWRDVWEHEHARAFTVAKAMRLDILRDIREASPHPMAEQARASRFPSITPPVLFDGVTRRRAVSGRWVTEGVVGAGITAILVTTSTQRA